MEQRIIMINIFLGINMKKKQLNSFMAGYTIGCLITGIVSLFILILISEF